MRQPRSPWSPRAWADQLTEVNRSEDRSMALFRTLKYPNLPTPARWRARAVRGRQPGGARHTVRHAPAGVGGARPGPGGRSGCENDAAAEVAGFEAVVGVGGVVEGEGVGDAEGEVAVGGEGGQAGQGLAVGGDPHVGDADAA